MSPTQPLTSSPVHRNTEPVRVRTPAAAQVVAAVDPCLLAPSCVHPWMRGSEGFLVVPPARPAAARSAFPSFTAAFACSPAFNSGVLTWQPH